MEKKMLLRELFNRNLNEAEAPDYVDSLKAIDTTDSLWKRSKRGSVKSDEVKALQQALNDLGYDAGTADGWFGRRTAAAVRKFQEDNDLTVDGDPGANTLSKMNDNIADKYPAEPEAEPEAELDDIAEPTGSGRGDGGAEVAARREEAAKAATEKFVREKVAELTRIRRNYPEDQLIRKITADAVEQGLNDDWAENGAMAAYIAELVPTVDRNDAAPEVGTAAPTLGQPSAGSDDSGPNIQSGDNAPVDTSAPARPQAPSMADRNIAAQKTAAQISAFQQAYGMGTDGQLPTLFRDRFLNPALDTLSLKTMKELSDELAGEIPQAVARVIVQRLERTYGNTQELTQAAQEMRSDTDPEIRDQVQALDLLIPLITKLKQDAARNESVEIDRIRMLAGV